MRSGLDDLRHMIPFVASQEAHEVRVGQCVFLIWFSQQVSCEAFRRSAPYPTPNVSRARKSREASGSGGHPHDACQVATVSLWLYYTIRGAAFCYNPAGRGRVLRGGPTRDSFATPTEQRFQWGILGSTTTSEEGDSFLLVRMFTKLVSVWVESYSIKNWAPKLTA